MGRLDRAFDVVVRALAWLAAGVILTIAVLIPLDLVLRNVFQASIYGLLEAVEYGLLAATFLAAPWVLAINGHVSVDLFAGALPGRWRRIADTVGNLVGASAAALFVWFAAVALIQSIERDAFIRTAFTIPEWCVLAVAPASMALVLIEFGRRLVRGNRTPDRHIT